MDQARAAMARHLQLDPAMNLSKFRQYNPTRKPADFGRFAEALRRAGMPEWLRLTRPFRRWRTAFSVPGRCPVIPRRRTSRPLAFKSTRPEAAPRAPSLAHLGRCGSMQRRNSRAEYRDE